MIAALRLLYPGGGEALGTGGTVEEDHQGSYQRIH